jgi:hypothetical protein
MSAAQGPCGLLAAATIVNLLLDRYVSVTRQAMVYVPL